MKLDRPLSPPLVHIERSLFGVSEMLIAAVERGETSAAIATAVRSSPEWAERNTAAPVPPDELSADVPSMPAHLRGLIARRLAAQATLQSSAKPLPAAGQIVEVRQIHTPKPGQLDWVMQVPLYVLLDAPGEAAGVWHGWLVSSEADYAGWWDFVLQEEDEPHAPEAALVQVWNPLRIYLPMAARLVGQLAPARLQAVRALATEYVTHEVPADVPVWPGRVAQRSTVGGLAVVTGSPLGDATDPRHTYQHLYHHAAEAIREPARLALAEAARAAAPAAALLALWEHAAARLGAAIRLVPRVEMAMSDLADEQAEQDLLWEDLARLCIDERTPDGAGRVQVSAESELAVCCELRIAGRLVYKQTARGGEGPAELEWEAGESATLTLSVADGRRLELPLAG